MTQIPIEDARAARRRRLYRRGVDLALVVTFGLIMLGAYVRLTDAGLGCPDWPGCYGKLTPHHAAEHISAAVAEQGGEHGPVSMGKAWREMVHRYIASALGLLIIALAVLGWRWRRDLPGGPVLPIVLVGVVVMQGLFGMWTVTLLLKPAIVTGHLLGGMLTLALILWLALRQRPRATEGATARASPPGVPGRAGVSDATGITRGLRAWVVAALVVVVGQITLGGWTSTNYAALACPDLPTCHGEWWPDADFEHAFHIVRELGQTPDGEPLTAANLTAIHLTHRIGAVVAAIVVGGVAWRARRVPALRGAATGVIAVLVLQWLLGLSNVAFDLPLWLAVAHNGGAAALLSMLIVLLYRVATPAQALR